MEGIGNYKGKVYESKSFENVNEGKPKLNTTDEYTFEMKKTILKLGKMNKFKQKLEDRVILICEEPTTKNEVSVSFRIDTLSWSATDDRFTSPVIKFFAALGQPIPNNGTYPDWNEYFIPSRKLKAHVKNWKQQGTVVEDRYVVNLETVRKWAQ
jgi:hypothetical protein